MGLSQNVKTHSDSLFLLLHRSLVNLPCSSLLTAENYAVA